MHGILPSLIKMCLTSNYLFVWGFSLKTANVSENINKHDMFFTLKFQLEKYRARAQQCSFAQHDRYLTQLGRLTAPVRTTWRCTRQELKVHCCPTELMENLTPCKAGVCIHHRCPTDTGWQFTLWHVRFLKPKLSHSPSHCWLKSRFLWCSYSSVSKTLPPPHSLGHKPLLSVGYREKQVSRRDLPAELFSTYPAHRCWLLCPLRSKQILTVWTAESLSRWQKYFSLSLLCSKTSASPLESPGCKPLRAQAGWVHLSPTHQGGLPKGPQGQSFPTFPGGKDLLPFSPESPPARAVNQSESARLSVSALILK